MIEDLLMYSRVGTRGKPFEPEDCENVFDQAVTNLKVAIVNRIVELHGGKVWVSVAMLKKPDRLQLSLYLLMVRYKYHYYRYQIMVFCTP